MTTRGDEARRRILARRAAFVAAALAGAGGACRPQPCLSPVPEPVGPVAPDGASSEASDAGGVEDASGVEDAVAPDAAGDGGGAPEASHDGRDAGTAPPATGRTAPQTRPRPPMPLPCLWIESPKGK